MGVRVWVVREPEGRSRSLRGEARRGETSIMGGRTQPPVGNQQQRELREQQERQQQQELEQRRVQQQERQQQQVLEQRRVQTQTAARDGIQSRAIASLTS